ncbi:hypothetical protein VF21_05892 [Pseudogymnoascus sp. 05NY08]|nr:hypothetical protein VF21_05892 [Pseudogymnoascus sp. 05NY08]
MAIAVDGQTDVLIVGAGPAGCMAAATLARYGIDFRLINKCGTRTQAGHASAFQPRTQEILQTLDLRHALDKQGHRLTETSFWTGDERDNFRRSYVGREVIHPTPYPYLFNSDQGITEATYEADLLSKGHKVYRYMELVHYDYPELANSNWPLMAYVKNHRSGAIEVWQAKYILGTDGARSTTRKLAQQLALPTSPCYRFNQIRQCDLESFHQQDIYSTYPERNTKYVVDMFLIHTMPHLQYDLKSVPQPFSDTWAARVYEDIDSLGHAVHGVSEKDGALALVRPDGYVSLVTGLDGLDRVVEFLRGFMLEGASQVDES